MTIHDEAVVADLRRRITDVETRVRSMLVDYSEVVDALADVLAQACTPVEPRVDGGELESGCLSAYADGLRVLAKLGRVEILKQHGRAVVATWVKTS